jgi:hypothetical protein
MSRVGPVATAQGGCGAVIVYHGALMLCVARVLRREEARIWLNRLGCYGIGAPVDGVHLRGALVYYSPNIA